MLHFYDFEVFKRLWTVVIINPQRRLKTVIVNDKEKLQEYYAKYKDEIFVGYNSREYDQWIFKAILCGFNPKGINDWIIQPGPNGERRKGWQYSDTLKLIPIIDFDVKTTYHGLKTLEAFMGNDIKETTIPFDYDGEFTPEMIEEVIKYNTHDVEQMMEVFIRRNNEFESQTDLLDTFKLPRKFIGKTQAQLAAIILGARKQKFDDEWGIRLPHTLKLDKYQHIADWFLNPENHDPDKELVVEVAEVPHTFAWGGVHGAIDKYNYACKPDEVLLMADVDQLYPSLMVYYGLLSRAVSEPERFSVILDKSLELKRLKRKKEREPYKRICNIAYGAMGDEYNYLYDPLHRRLVCIYGQLLILDLLEKVEDFTELIQSNTDGILVKIKRSDMDRFKAVVKEWEDRTMLHMSFDEFKAIYQKDVNNYLAIDFNGEVKGKGGYVKDLNDLDNDLPIVKKAVKAYLIDGTDPSETVMACDDLIDFQKVVSVSRKYICGIKNATFRITDKGVRIWNRDGERLTDKTFRVFASTRPGDLGIHKLKSEDAINPDKFANTPDKCFIFNSALMGVAIPPYLDKSWYCDLAVKRLNDFGVNIYE